MELSTILLLIFGLSLSFVAAFFIFKKILSKKDLLKPKLSVSIESSNDTFCGVKLMNKGEGTAIIKNINIWDATDLTGQKNKKSIDKVFPFYKTYWMNNTNFEEGREYYLASGETFYFGKIYKERVQKNGGNYPKIKSTFDQKIKDIKIEIEYNDVFENPQAPFLYSN